MCRFGAISKTKYLLVKRDDEYNKILSSLLIQEIGMLSL